MDAIYRELTYRILEKTLEIRSSNDRDIIMFSVLEYYMPNNVGKLTPNQQIVYQLLEKNVGGRIKEKRIKRYFITLMQECNGCTLKYIKRLDEDKLEWLDIGITTMERENIAEAIKEADFVAIPLSRHRRNFLPE